MLLTQDFFHESKIISRLSTLSLKLVIGSHLPIILLLSSIIYMYQLPSYHSFVIKLLVILIGQSVDNFWRISLVILGQTTNNFRLVKKVL